MGRADKKKYSRTKDMNFGELIVDELKHRWQLYVMLILPVVYIILFCYIPMSGVLMAFEDYSIRRGIFGSQWVGLKVFKQVFSNPMFPVILRNTLLLSIFGFVAGFPVPIILALSLNECRHERFRKTVQMLTYMPYFISTVVMVSMMTQLLHVRNGLINRMIVAFGGRNVDFMGNMNYFRSVYVISGIWQSAGYSAIIYLAALAGVDSSLQEAALIDGANRWQRVFHVDLPAILPTIVIQMIFAVGNLLSIGYEKVFLMQNDLNMLVSETISTYVYKRGLKDVQYSYSTAVDLFNSVANLILITFANYVSKKVTETSLW